MRIVLQKVSHAELTINPDESIPTTVGYNSLSSERRSIDMGYVLLVAVEDSDTLYDVQWVARKISHLRIFEDQQGKMNFSIHDVHGAVLSISQFTLFADIQHGNRPSFIRAGKPDHALRLWNALNDELTNVHNIEVKTGIFGSHMNVNLTNDGPVILFIDTAQARKK